MTKATRLNDLQLILLAHAAGRDDGHTLPFPDSISDADRATHECKSLLRRGFMAEAATPNAAATWRMEDDQRIGLVLTDSGRSVIGMETAPNRQETFEGEVPLAAASERSASKRTLVIDLLRRDEGATLAELVEATGWQPHSTRAALTGLRKQGHAVTKAKRGEVTCYHIAGDA